MKKSLRRLPAFSCLPSPGVLVSLLILLNSLKKEREVQFLWCSSFWRAASSQPRNESEREGERESAHACPVLLSACPS